MSQNGQTYFKNLTANAAIFSKCISPFGTLSIKGLMIYIYRKHHHCNSINRDFLTENFINT